ncbi:hypothetical protein [Smaragdicoccus niigatensis]|uniref:hypothetical protein n=1 Tax=Smaragdicoccus niigatensis TaxID=359359 RepID=UPI00037BB44D|nr:hypothetical protein [Smaragdicoccus niigatensis]
MSQLATQAEVLKLARLFDVDPDEVEFLVGIQPDALRLLRESITEYLYEEDQPMFRALAPIVGRVPTKLAVKVAGRVHPVLLGGIAALLKPSRMVTYACAFPIPMLADVGVYVDPRRVREVLRLLPADVIVDVALELEARGDFSTISKFIDYVSDETLRAVEEALPDETALLKVAFMMESKNRVDHIFRMLPRERIERLLQRIQQDPAGLLSEFLSLLVHVSYGFKRELGDIFANQAEGLINEYILEAHRRGLWIDVLPVVSAMSPPSQHRVVNLPALREDEVQRSILLAAEEHDMWGVVLPMIGQMGDENRAAVSEIMVSLGATSMQAATEAALMGECWPVLLDLVTRMEETKQAEFGRVLQAIGEVDPTLHTRIVEMAVEAGISREMLPEPAELVA